MKVTKTTKYTLIKNTQNTVLPFFEEFSKQYSNYKNENLVLDISENINTTIKEILLFLKIAVMHKNNGTSFVIVCNRVDIDTIPDELNVVPTLIEAEDIIEMDEIERDLGF